MPVTKIGAINPTAPPININITREHKLKTLAPYWEALASGEKTFDVRFDDRGFQRGDIVVFLKLKFDNAIAPYQYETDGYGTSASPKSIRKRISWILTGGRFGIKAGYVAMGLVDVDVTYASTD